MGNAVCGFTWVFCVREEGLVVILEVGIVHYRGVCGGREAVFGSLPETVTCLHSVMMKGDACAEMCRTCRQKRYYSLYV